MEKRIVLLVADNPDDVRLAFLALKKDNFTDRIVFVSDGREALKWISRTGSHADRNPDLVPAAVLLDLQLLRIDSLEVIQRLRADDRTRFLPVVVLTSSREEQDLVASYRSGCNSCILKPADFDDFIGVLRQLSLYWLTLNEPPRLYAPCKT